MPRDDEREKRWIRIGRTDSGYAWLRRIEEIGKPEPWTRAPGARKESKVARTRHRLSKHFVVEEFDCKDGTKVSPRDYKGLEYLCRQYLEPMRRKYGACSVHSGFRTRRWNDHVGGEDGSYHIYPDHDGNDQAADVSFARGNASNWHATANWIRRRKRGGRGGLGLYRTFVHIDLRDYSANWRG